MNYIAINGIPDVKKDPKTFNYLFGALDNLIPYNEKNEEILNKYALNRTKSRAHFRVFHFSQKKRTEWCSSLNIHRLKDKKIKL